MPLKLVITLICIKGVVQHSLTTGLVIIA